MILYCLNFFFLSFWLFFVFSSGVFAPVDIFIQNLLFILISTFHYFLCSESCSGNFLIFPLKTVEKFVDEIKTKTTVEQFLVTLIGMKGINVTDDVT